MSRIKTIQTNFRISEDLREKINFIADKEARSKSNVIEIAVIKYFNNLKKREFKNEN